MAGAKVGIRLQEVAGSVSPLHVARELSAKALHNLDAM
jgi:hypothetical protein